MGNITSYLKNRNQTFEVSYLGIRRAVGILGILLPVVVSLGAWIFGGCHYLKDSISDYYYTIMGTGFTGILCGVALFMYSYKGFDNWDRVTSNLACVFALGVAFFPMNVDAKKCAECAYCDITSRAVQPWRDAVHFGSAAALFLTFACMSLFLFTKTDKNKKPTRKKLQRNVVYRVCGIVIIAALLVIGCIKLGWLSGTFLPHSTFWMEFIMLWAFGASWLVKGETLLKD